RDRSSPNGATVDAPPGLASLDTLVAHHAATGLAVTVGTAGTPRPLGGTVDQAAYRIIQEALTNAARHGAGGARIELEFGDTGLELTVTNPVPVTAGARSSGRQSSRVRTDGSGEPVPVAAGARSSGGHGVIGMHERASLVGGTLDAGRAGGEFRVGARLPYTGQRAWPGCWSAVTTT